MKTVKEKWCNYCGQFVYENNRSEHQLASCEVVTVETPVVGSVGSTFIGLMKTERGYSLRLYNITGDHPNKGSTVTVDTLVDVNVPILDMTDAEVQTEYALCKSYMKEEIL